MAQRYKSIKMGDEWAIVIGSLFYGRELPTGQFRQYRYKTKSDAVKQVKKLNRSLR